MVMYDPMVILMVVYPWEDAYFPWQGRGGLAGVGGEAEANFPSHRLGGTYSFDLFFYGFFIGFQHTLGKVVTWCF